MMNLLTYITIAKRVTLSTKARTGLWNSSVNTVYEITKNIHYGQCIVFTVTRGTSTTELEYPGCDTLTKGRATLQDIVTQYTS